MRYEEMMNIPTCGNKCGKLTKSTPVLVAVYYAQYDYDDSDQFTCGWCSNNDLWTIPEMMWNEDEEYFVTPCCHTEAITSLRPEDKAREYDHDQAREDYESFVWAVTGR
jgi:hypothetical protein